MFDNFADSDVAANITATSSDTSFPLTNALNKQRRSRVWRSAGFFEVTSSNNTIIFRETVAVDLTATITAGFYSSLTAFSAAVKTALEAVGASTYTVTNDGTTNFKFTIASDGAGGGGVLELRFADASNTSEGLLGFDSTNLSGSLSYNGDFLKLHTEEAILFDLGIAANPQDFILIGPRNRPLRFSPTATLKLQANPTNNFTSPAFESTLTLKDRAIVSLSTTGLGTTSYRFWRIQFVDQNPNGFVEVGAFFLGNHYTPTRNPQFPFVTTHEDRSISVISEGGTDYP